MGRRSTKTTKTGKFMNPTDQWRKQCRKRELKKNKFQRIAVREAVLKSKNPREILQEIEEIEKMEAESPADDPLPTDKGLKEKKRKLHETLSRVIRHFEKEDPKKAQDIKAMVVDSEHHRRELSKVYNSYRAARSQYDVSDIPMPDAPLTGEPSDVVATSDIPMPSALGPDEEQLEIGPPSGIPPGMVPPGPPPGPPPDIAFPEAVVASSYPPKSVRFADADEASDEEFSSEESESSNDDLSDEEQEMQEPRKDNKPKQNEGQLVPPGPPPGPPPGLPMFSAHPPPPLFNQAPPPPLGRFGVPPGPPPGIPPPPSHPPPNISSSVPRPLIPTGSKLQGGNAPHIQSSAILSAPSTGKAKGSSKPSAIISAQPQLRNIQAEVTKFLPTALRVRRDQPKISKPRLRTQPGMAQESKASMSSSAGLAGTGRSSGGLQGDYDTFMQEMQGLL